LRSLVRRRRYRFFSAPVGLSLDASFGGYEFRELAAADFQSTGFFQQQGRARRFVARLDDGHRCFGFVDGSNAVAYFWLTREGVAPLSFDLGLTLPPDGAYVWDCRTDQGHARRGLYREGLLRMRALHRFGSVWISCERDNVASVKGIEGAGFAGRFEVELAKVWRWRRIKRAGEQAAWRRPGALLSIAALCEGRID